MWSFLTNSVQFSKIISGLSPPNPLGFCLSYRKLPGNSHCLSWGPLESVISFAFLKDNWRKCSEWDSGMGGCWGMRIPIYIALGRDCGGRDGKWVNLRAVWEMHTTLWPMLPSSLSLQLSSQPLWLPSTPKFEWLFMKIMESMKRLHKTSLIILAGPFDFTVKFNLTWPQNRFDLNSITD